MVRRHQHAKLAAIPSMHSTENVQWSIGLTSNIWSVGPAVSQSVSQPIDYLGNGQPADGWTDSIKHISVPPKATGINISTNAKGLPCRMLTYSLWIPCSLMASIALAIGGPMNYLQHNLKPMNAFSTTKYNVLRKMIPWSMSSNHLIQHSCMVSTNMMAIKNE